MTPMSETAETLAADIAEIVTAPVSPGNPAEPRLLSLPGRLRRERLANGLEVCLIDNRQAPLVTSVIARASPPSARRYRR